jgi:hypothetical protein
LSIIDFASRIDSGLKLEFGVFVSTIGFLDCSIRLRTCSLFCACFE